MRWKDGRRSGNVEDRRGSRLSGKAKGGGIGLLVLVLVGLFFGIDPSLILQLGGNVTGPAVQESQYVPTEAENELADFVSVVLIPGGRYSTRPAAAMKNRPWCCLPVQ
jgi:predicted metalloprotease